MGRPPSNGGPSFRFTQPEIAEMESILQAHKTAMPERQLLVNLSEKFSNSEERKGKIEVQMKQVWNWFQNRRYAIRAKAAKHPEMLTITQVPRDDSAPMVKGVPQPQAAASSVAVRTLPQAPQHPTVPSAAVRTFPQAPPQPAFSGRVTDNSQMEYEAKSARDGAWYDVSTFLSHRSLETGDPEVMVRFAGFGAEEDEWVNVRKNVRQRSLPCEASECVAVLPADLILCFQEGKEQALYFDAHVLDAQRRRHDVRGCRCRFLVRYDHDQSEEIVALRKICRRPETDFRLHQLHAANESLSVNQNKNGANNNIHTVSTLRVYPPEVQPKQNSVVPPGAPLLAESPQKRQRLDSTVPPEGPQSQFKAEPVALADVPQNQQKVQAAEPAPSASPLVDPPKLESVVPSPSTQASAELKNDAPTVVTRSDEVPLELQKVQPVMPDPLSEASIDTYNVEIVVPLPEASELHHKTEPVLSGEIPQEPQEVGPTVPLSKEITVEAPVASHEEEPDVPADLHEVQPAVLEQTQSIKNEEPVVPFPTDEPNVELVESVETKTEEPAVSANNPNVVEESVEAKTEEPVEPFPTDEPNAELVETVETKTEEPVVSANNPNMVKESVEVKIEEPVGPTNEPNVVETKTEELVVPTNEPNNDPSVVEETMENNEDNYAKVAENESENKVENSDLEPENIAVAMEEG